MRTFFVAKFLLLTGAAARPMLHIFLPPWNASDEVSRHQDNGEVWYPGPQMMSYGMDPATAVHSMLEGVDMVSVNASGHEQVALRLNFTNDEQTMKHRRTVMKQTVELGLAGERSENLISSRAFLQKLLSFRRAGYRPIRQQKKQTQLILPLNNRTEATPLAQYISKHYGRAVKPLLPPTLGWSSVGGSKAFAFSSDKLYMVVGARIVEVMLETVPPSGGCPAHAKYGNVNRSCREETTKAGADRVIFGGKVGTALDQLGVPENVPSIVFHQDKLYVVEGVGSGSAATLDERIGNNRILVLLPGQSKAEVFFGGNGRGSRLNQVNDPRDIAFFEGKAYISDSGNHRILEVTPGKSKAKLFFGGKGPGSRLDQLNNPGVIMFLKGKAYVVDYSNHRILEVTPGKSKAKLFFGGQGPDKLLYPRSMAFFEGKAYIGTSEGFMEITPDKSKARLAFKYHRAEDQISFYRGKAYVVLGHWPFHRHHAGLVQLTPGPWTAKFLLRKHRALQEQLNGAQRVRICESQVYVLGQKDIKRVMPRQSKAETFWEGSEPLADLAFYKNKSYAVQRQGGQVLEITPGESKSKIFFAATTPYSNFNGITFFEDKAYIVDATFHRILEVTPGKSKAKTFFGGKGMGSRLDQLYNPTSMTWFEGKAYVVDQWNRRVLEVTPGKSWAKLFFGGKGLGDGVRLDQLTTPVDIAFFKGVAYIVDGCNTWPRILRVTPGESFAEVFAQRYLDHPVSIAFHNGNAYVTSLTTVTVLSMAVLEEPSNRTVDLGGALARCQRGALFSRGDTDIFLAKCQVASAMVEVAASKPSITLEAPNYDVSMEITNRAAHLPVVGFTKLTLPWAEVHVPTRKFKFGLCLAALAAASFGAHGVGRRAGHLSFLLLAFCVFLAALHFELCFLPIPDSYLWSSLTLVGGLFLPWAMVPLLLFLSFDSLTKHAFTSDAPLAVSCALGTGWEYHLLTAFLMAASTSVWALCLGEDSTPPPAPLATIPNFCSLRKLMENHFPWLVEKVEHPNASARRLLQLLKWVQTSMGDQYLDLTTCLVFQACGYDYAWLSLVCILSALCLQNLGGALYILCCSRGHGLPASQTCVYALIALVMAPPLKQLNEKLTPAAMYVTMVRLISEDLPQLLIQLHFTIFVYQNPFVLFNVMLTLLFAAMDVKALCSYCQPKKFEPIPQVDKTSTQHHQIALMPLAKAEEASSA